MTLESIFSNTAGRKAVTLTCPNPDCQITREYGVGENDQYTECSACGTKIDL